MTKICLFDRKAGASILELPEATIDRPEIEHDGTVYRRHVMSAFVVENRLDESFVYADCTLTLDDEFKVFETLYPNRGGVFQIDPA